MRATLSNNMIKEKYMDVELININKNYGKVTAVENFSLGIKQGEFLVLLGPSGCGKTTTLRMIAGLENIDEGDLLIEGKRMNDVLPKYRDLAMVFQSYALYPHMTVEENVGYPLKMRGVKGKEKTDAIMLACRQVQISDLTQRYPKQLSGGEAQRISIARALSTGPGIVFADEPTGNLDRDTSLEIGKLIQKINSLGTTIVFATHDHDVMELLKEARHINLEKGKLVGDSKKPSKEKKEVVEKDMPENKLETTKEEVKKPTRKKKVKTKAKSKKK